MLELLEEHSRVQNFYNRSNKLAGLLNPPGLFALADFRVFSVNPPSFPLLGECSCGLRSVQGDARQVSNFGRLRLAFGR
jgi:hypothetical protein